MYDVMAGASCRCSIDEAPDSLPRHKFLGYAGNDCGGGGWASLVQAIGASFIKPRTAAPSYALGRADEDDRGDACGTDDVDIGDCGWR